MKKIILLTTVLLFLASSVWADEAEDEINKALSAYQKKDYTAAVKSLDIASTQIRHLKALRMAEALPEPLADWTAQEPETSSMAPSVFGGFTSVSRRYFREGSQIKIEIVSDSPMILIATGMMETPLFIEGVTKRIKIGDRMAYLEGGDIEGSEKINVVVEDKVLVTITAVNCKKGDILAYANAVDYDKIEALSSQ